ncbi:MAG: hypothetical protein ACFFFT_05490 [Candidatus Thorarchaeota archaeon]
MNINEKLSSLSKNEFGKYHCNKNEMLDFLNFTGPFENRQQIAIDIIEGIMTRHGKEHLLSHVVELARVEQGIKELEPWVRDHVVHAVLSFILGIFINERFLTPVMEVSVDSFQWKLSGLFHDVGYPIQIGQDIMKPFTDRVNQISENIGVKSEKVSFKIEPVGFDNLHNNVNSFHLIQNRLSEWEMGIDAMYEFKLMIKKSAICHGIMSSLAILYIIDQLYQKFNPKRKYKDIYKKYTKINWNQNYFENDVVSAAAAIFIHNLPVDRFKEKKIDPQKIPLPFLLKLSDLLQDWQRPSDFNKQGFPPENYDIEIKNNNLYFKINNENNRKSNLEGEIRATLLSDNIKII